MPDPVAQHAIRDQLDSGYPAIDRIRKANAELRAALAPEGNSHRGPGSEDAAPTEIENLIAALDQARAEHAYIYGIARKAQDRAEAAEEERDEAGAEVERLKSTERDTTGLSYGDKAAWRHLIARAVTAEAAVASGLALAREWEAIANRWGEHMPRTAINRVHARRLRAALADATETSEE